MNLTLTEAQRMLSDAAERLFAAESTPLRVRGAERGGGFDPALWAQVRQLGMHGLRMPESAGGLGLGLFEAVLVAEAAGRHLAAVPLAEALAASGLLCRLADLAGGLAQAWRGRVAEGALVVLAPAPLEAGMPAVIPGGGAAEAALLLWGEQVLLLPGSAHQARDSLGAAALSQPRSVDAQGRPEAALVLAEGPAARRAFEAAVEEWKLLNAALLVGLSRQALALAAAYAGERQQFGKSIGSFQGIAHPLADALAEIDGARLLVWRAVWALAHRPAEGAAAISMAWWWTAGSATRAATRALHTFGGYGVSLEYDIQLYYRRAKAWVLPLGDAQGELDRLGERLWGAPEVALPEAGEMPLVFGVGPQAEAFADEVRAFFRTHLTPELRAHAHHSADGHHPGFARRMAQAGLLFPHWPEAWGGRGKTAFDMAALGEVLEEYGWQRITAPITNQVAQILMRFGTPEARQEILPRFARGEALACMGFSEPASGCDVFAARTRGVRDADHWIIDGQKIFTTAANVADYIFLLVRTDPQAPKHKGLSLFLVPMDLPGIELQAIHTVQDERTNVTFLSEVRVHDRYRVGEVHGGLAVMAATLELEHGGEQYRVSYAHMVEQAVAWARRQQRAGRPLIDQAAVRRRLAPMVVRAKVAEQLCHRALWAVAGQVPGRAAYGPMAKVFTTESYVQDTAELMDLCAPFSVFSDNPEVGQIELGYRQSVGMTIYGGTSEVQRSLIAEQGLGLPSSRA
ncbi:MAG: acyl-CoA dehydrogenase [Rhodocyclaceae bacterium]|jgi:alkylation response protein AidB-like acyl-CoA dehydrogenase|nr:acyl-CoA dehydrogenase [Rhodocyclaceae bacterium]